jgi:gamma-D-glutamyl-L-lysine dipeptidyl-peptidase
MIFESSEKRGPGEGMNGIAPDIRPRNPANNPIVIGISSPLLSVIVPAANLRKEPIGVRPGLHDDLQESQLLTNELFRPLREEQDWYYGEAIEQPYYTEEGWSGYPGWVKKSDVASVKTVRRRNAVIVSREAGVFPGPECKGKPLITLPLGARIATEPENGIKRPACKVHLYSGQAGWVRRDGLRLLDGSREVSSTKGLIREVVENAFLFLGVPYVWGGMSIPLAGGASQVVAGVDCSALVCLSYRLSGIDVPRNAHDQWIFARPVEGNGPQTGDLVFIAKEDAPKAVRHVMIFIGRESMIEASETGRTVSETSFAEKFGLSCRELRQAGFVVEGKQICFGRIGRGLDLEG